MRHTALLIQTDPVDGPCRLGEWLGEAGLSVEVAHPYRGEPVPRVPDRYAALIVLGAEAVAEAETAAVSESRAADAAGPVAGSADALREAVRRRLPTLAIGAGAHLFTTAHGGSVERTDAGPELGPRLVGRRDAAEQDPIFARVPFAPDVIQWHHAGITRLPDGAVLLAASTRYPYQAYRLGDRAWALQFHIEPDAAAVAAWAARDAAALAAAGRDGAGVVAATEAVLEDIAEAWQPFAARFAGLARGELAGPARAPLPLLGG